MSSRKNVNPAFFLILLLVIACRPQPDAAKMVKQWCDLNQKAISAKDTQLRDEALDELEKLEKTLEKKYPDKEKNREFWAEIEQGISECIKEHGHYGDRLLEDMHQ